jgi:hypothetical protein
MKPGRGRSRHPILAGLVIAASLALLFMMRGEIAYFFQGSEPKDVGTAPEAIEEGELEANAYVRLRGIPDVNTWATVSRRGCSLSPKSAPKDYYSFYILRNTKDRVVVRRSLTWKQRAERQKRKVLKLDVSGRLLRFADEEAYFRKYRGFLGKLSKANPNLRTIHELSPKTLRKHLGKNRPLVTDHRGREVRIEPREEIAIYAIFPDQLEISIARAHEVKADKVTFVGGSGANECLPSARRRGGDVVLVKDPKVLDLGGLPPGGEIKGHDASSKRGEPAEGETGGGGAATTDAWDEVIRVPPSTRAFDAKTGDQVKFKDGRLVAARGGECKKPGERVALNFDAQPLRTEEAAARFINRLGHPFLLVEKDKVSFDFIVQGPHAKMKEIVENHRREDPYTVDFRTEWYLARWNELRLREDTLVISPARPSHPVDYEPVERKAGGQKKNGASKEGGGMAAFPRLRKKPFENEVRIHFDRVKKARFSTARSMAEDAWILLEGEEPMEYWYYPLIGLLLMGFIVFNLLAIKNYFKYVHKPKHY